MCLVLKRNIDCQELIECDSAKPKYRVRHYSKYQCLLHNEMEIRLFRLSKIISHILASVVRTIMLSSWSMVNHSFSIQQVFGQQI